MQNAHHSFPEHKMTYSHVLFCLNILNTLSSMTKKQQIITSEQLKSANALGKIFIIVDN